MRKNSKIVPQNHEKQNDFCIDATAIFCVEFALMAFPMLLVNAKSFPQSILSGAVHLANACASVSQKTGISIGFIPNILDLAVVCAMRLPIPIFSPHADAKSLGSATGAICPALLARLGCTGSLLNHSEKPLSSAEIEASIMALRKENLASIVCAPSVELVKNFSHFSPDAIALEPPNLIGGTVSVATHPFEIEASKIACGNAKLIVGAGVSTAKDFAKALQLGALSVLVGSAIAKSDDPESALLHLLSGS